MNPVKSFTLFGNKDLLYTRLVTQEMSDGSFLSFSLALFITLI